MHKGDRMSWPPIDSTEARELRELGELEHARVDDERPSPVGEREQRLASLPAELRDDLERRALAQLEAAGCAPFGRAPRALLVRRALELLDEAAP